MDPGVLSDLTRALLSGERPDLGRDGGVGLLDPEPLYLRRPDAVASAPAAAVAR